MIKKKIRLTDLGTIIEGVVYCFLDLLQYSKAESNLTKTKVKSTLKGG